MPYIIVMAQERINELWTREEFTDLATARAYAAELSKTHYQVHLMTGQMEAKWGPADPGGLFNRMPRKQRNQESD